MSFESAREKNDDPAAAAGAAGDGSDTAAERHTGSDGASVDRLVTNNNSNQTPPETLTRKEKVKRHFQRLWLWYLLEVVILLAIALPITFKVIVPAIMQRIVGEQGLPVLGGSFQATSPEEVTITFNTELWSPIKAEMDAAELQLYNADAPEFSPFVTLHLGQQWIYQVIPASIEHDKVTITNQSELVRWLNQVYDEETVEVSVRSHPMIRLGELNSETYLDKTLSLNGLNGLKGIHVGDLNVILPALANGSNINGTIVMPNHSVLELDLGDLILNMYSGDIMLGTVFVNDVVLAPSTNTTKFFTGELYLNKLGPNLSNILASQTAALMTGNIQLNTTSNSTTRGGIHIPYLESVLNSKTLTLDISVVSLVSDLLTGVLHGGKTSIVDALGDVLGNHSFVESVVNNFNSSDVSTNGSSVASKVKARRAMAQGSMMWNMLRLADKVKREL